MYIKYMVAVRVQRQATQSKLAAAQDVVIQWLIENTKSRVVRPCHTKNNLNPIVRKPAYQKKRTRYPNGAEDRHLFGATLVLERRMPQS